MAGAYMNRTCNVLALTGVWNMDLSCSQNQSSRKKVSRFTV